MIKINLALRKQSLSAEGARGGALGGLSGLGSPDQLVKALEVFKDFPWKKIVVPVLVAVAATYTVDQLKESALQKIEEEVSSVMAEKPKLEQEAQKLKSYEGIKKELESDEAVMRIKIDTIKKLIQGRSTPPKVLITLANTVPKEVWIEEFKVEDSKVSIRGSSKGYGPISDFMKSIGESIYFGEMVLKGTQQAKDSSGDEVINFELEGKQR